MRMTGLRSKTRRLSFAADGYGWKSTAEVVMDSDMQPTMTWIPPACVKGTAVAENLSRFPAPPKSPLLRARTRRHLRPLLNCLGPCQQGGLHQALPPARTPLAPRRSRLCARARVRPQWGRSAFCGRSTGGSGRRRPGGFGSCRDDILNGSLRGIGRRAERVLAVWAADRLCLLFAIDGLVMALF